MGLALRRGVACYRELPRIPLPRTPLNSPYATLRAPDLARSRAHLGHGLFNERSDDIRPRNVDRVAARGLLDGRTCPLRHRALGGRGDHPVFSRDEVPAWLAPPCRLADR